MIPWVISLTCMGAMHWDGTCPYWYEYNGALNTWDVNINKYMEGHKDKEFYKEGMAPILALKVKVDVREVK